MTGEELKQKLTELFGDKLTLLEVGCGVPTYEVAPADLVDICRQLRDNEALRFDYLCNLGGIDTGERLEVQYNLASLALKHRLDLKVILPDDNQAVDSIQEIWPAANWYEREVWELYGIGVNNHGNLTRFLLPDDWDQGHPMRKNWDAPDFVRLPEFKP